MADSIPSQVNRPVAVRITVGARVAVVRPPHEDVLRPVLSYDEFTFRADPAGRVTHCLTTVHVNERSGDGLEISIGCISRAVRHLRQAGYEVQVEDRRDRSAHPYRIEAHYCGYSRCNVQDLR